MADDEDFWTGLSEETDSMGATLRSHNRDRMREWRKAQKALGRVQVRAWVPACKVDVLLEFAARLRDEGADYGVVPSTPKQRYEAGRAARAWGLPLPPERILNDKLALAAWLTVFDRRLIEEDRVSPPPAGRIEEAAELAAMVGVEMPMAVQYDRRACSNWIRKMRRRLNGR